MRIVTEFPRPVREIENLWVPLADGTRLAARVWLPEDADAKPVPAILEYLPYRKRDGTIVRDQLTHPYFAGHGYAAVRVDMRGNGDSEGLMEDEYTKQEQDDAAHRHGIAGPVGDSAGRGGQPPAGARSPGALRAPGQYSTVRVTAAVYTPAAWFARGDTVAPMYTNNAPVALSVAAVGVPDGVNPVPVGAAVVL